MKEVSEASTELLSVSSGVGYLAEGYIDYAREVIVNRALPDMRDGLKPVNRRILETLLADSKKIKGYYKSGRAVGNTMAIHPHGDASIYAAMVLMTQKNGSLAFPLVDGSGNFGGVYKTDPPAAQRYTEVKIHANAQEYFQEMNGVDMVPNYDSTQEEATVLPVSFPAVLVNSTSGIAVGFKSNIPSFNFNDVCDLVTEYIKDGHCHTVIYPDFVTGAYYIKDDKELKRLMTTGKAKLKLRGKAVTVDKEIQVTEVPFGKTIQGLVKQINSGNFSAIKNAYDSDDFEHGTAFTVKCTAKNRLDEALYLMYKDTDFQYTYNADITVINDGVPQRMGVYQVIEDWVAWRKQVLTREYTYRRDVWVERIREATAFMNVVNSYEKRMKLVEIIASEGRDKGREYIAQNFTREEVPEDLIKFVSSRALPDYHDGGKYASDYANGSLEIAKLEKVLNDLDGFIVGQMEQLKRTYGVKMPRKTEVTTTDFEFSDDLESKEQVVDNSSCYYIMKNGFLRKLHYRHEDADAQYQFDGYANDTLIAFDNRGRILRVYCKDLPFHGQADLGIYLARHFNLNEGDDYRITYIGRLTGETLMLLYKDGNVGFVDTSEWVGNNRNVKVLEKGISSVCADKLGAVIETIPEVLMVTDAQGRLAWVHTEDIKRKDRTAKTRVFNLTRNTELAGFSCQSEVNLPLILPNSSAYFGKLKFLESAEDWRGKDNTFATMM